MKTTIHASSNRTDDRRNKRYGREVTVTVTEIQPADVASSAHYNIRRHTFAGGIKPKHTHGDDGRRYGDERGGSMHVTFFAKATRPSEILPERHAVTWVEPLVTEIVAILKSCIAQHSDDARRANLAKQATQVADWIGNESRTTAKAAIDYDARLRELQDELDAAVAAARATFVAEMSLDPADGFAPEAVEVAKRESHRFTGERGFMRTVPEISVDEFPTAAIKTFGGESC